MKAMLQIWGDGDFHDFGPVKNTSAFKSLLKKIEDGTWKREDYDSVWPNSDVLADFGIDPYSAIVTIFAMKNGKVTKKKLFEMELDELPEKCFSHRFVSLDWIGKRIWRFQQTVHAKWLWQKIDIPRGCSFDPKKLHIDVEHSIFGEEEVYSNIGSNTYYIDKNTGAFNTFDPAETEYGWGVYTELNVYERKTRKKLK